MNEQNSAIISEFGLIGSNESVLTANKFLSAYVEDKFYKELESFAKTNTGKDILQFTHNGKYLQAKSYVGIIRTSNGCILEIVPKMSKEESVNDSKQVFMKLLHLLYKLPNYKNIDSANFERLSDINIFEIFIIMFLDEVGLIIKKGIKSDYIDTQDNLFYLKGKLLMNEQIKRNSVHKERFFVEYDDYNQNRAENRLIKSTLHLLFNISRDFKNQKRIRQYLEHLNWVEKSQSIDNDIRQIKMGRGMNHYNNALIWAKVFLKKESFSSFSGDTIAFAILYPMEKLWECFVEWYLNKQYQSFIIESQSSGMVFVKNLFGVRPDFLIKKNNKVLCVADAKWKLINQESDFSQSDFYQLFTYKHIFFGTSSLEDFGETNLRIYYPKTTEYLDEEKEFNFFNNNGIISIIPLDIKQELIKS